PISAKRARKAVRSRPNKFTSSARPPFGGLAGAGAGTGLAPARAGGQLPGAGEVAGLDPRGLQRGRALPRRLLAALREIGADRALLRLLRIRGAHDVAVLRDGVRAFEHRHHHGTAGHELHEVLEERTLLVNRVEAFSLAGRHVLHARGDDLEARFLEA